jgi:hypothetical protein
MNLFFIPVLYVLVEALRERILGKKRAEAPRNA